MPLVFRSQVRVVKATSRARFLCRSFASLDVFEVVAEARISRHEGFGIGEHAVPLPWRTQPLLPLTQFGIAPKPKLVA